MKLVAALLAVLVLGMALWPLGEQSSPDGRGDARKVQGQPTASPLNSAGPGSDERTGAQAPAPSHGGFPKGTIRLVESVSGREIRGEILVFSGVAGGGEGAPVRYVEANAKGFSLGQFLLKVVPGKQYSLPMVRSGSVIVSFRGQSDGAQAAAALLGPAPVRSPEVVPWAQLFAAARGGAGVGELLQGFERFDLSTPLECHGKPWGWSRGSITEGELVWRDVPIGRGYRWRLFGRFAEAVVPKHETYVAPGSSVTPDFGELQNVGVSGEFEVLPGRETCHVVDCRTLSGITGVLLEHPIDGDAYVDVFRESPMERADGTLGWSSRHVRTVAADEGGRFLSEGLRPGAHSWVAHWRDSTPGGALRLRYCKGYVSLEPDSVVDVGAVSPQVGGNLIVNVRFVRVENGIEAEVAPPAGLEQVLVYLDPDPDVEVMSMVTTAFRHDPSKPIMFGSLAWGGYSVRVAPIDGHWPEVEGGLFLTGRGGESVDVTIPEDVSATISIRLAPRARASFDLSWPDTVPDSWPPASLRGYLLSEDGKTDLEFYLTADGEMTARADAREGSFLAVVAWTDGDDLHGLSSAQEVELVDGCRHSLVLTKGVTAEGRVLSLGQGLGVPGSYVQAAPLIVENEYAVVFWPFVTKTDGEGRFVLGGLPAHQEIELRAGGSTLRTGSPGSSMRMEPFYR